MELLGLGRSLIDDIRAQIITGAFTAGSRINENQLAKKLDISRGPVREALCVLETENLVVNIPRKGSFVTEISVKNMNEIFLIREMIECFAIKILEIKKIRDLPKVYEAADSNLTVELPSRESSNKEKLAYLIKMGEFHFKLIESTGNEQLFQLYKNIYSNINRYVFLSSFSGTPPKHRSDDHLKILKHINHGRYVEAKKYMKNHIRLAKEDIEMNAEDIDKISIKNPRY